MVSNKTRIGRTAGGWLAAAAIALGGTGATAAGPASARPASSAPAMAVTLVSAQPHTLPRDFPGSARLLTHTMPAFNGGTSRATTLLLVPAGRPPAGGWPIVGWIHGTTSTGGRDCAPSLSPDLDGGLTRDGFVSGYAAELASLVNAGYAVVAPDLEGLGPEGKAPYPYYIRASEPRSVIAGIIAARQAEPALSKRWVVFGHSEGAHGALATEAYAGERPAQKVELLPHLGLLPLPPPFTGRGALSRPACPGVGAEVVEERQVGARQATSLEDVGKRQSLISQQGVRVVVRTINQHADPFERFCTLQAVYRQTRHCQIPSRKTAPPTRMPISRPFRS